MTNRSKAFLSLLGAAVVFVILPSLPFGHTIMWPFTMLTTFVHELGHGLAAIAMGGSIIKLELFSSGGGLAHYSGVAPGFGRAVVAASGLLAPPIAGALFIFSGRSRKSSSIILTGFAVLMLVSCALWVRTHYGLLLIGGLGLLFLFFAFRSKAGVHQFLIQFFAVHMLVDTLTRTMQYLFTHRAVYGDSDTTQIASNLGGTFWMWGLLIAAIALLLFYLSFRRVYLK